MASCLALVWALALGAAQVPQARANSGTITANGPAVTAIISTPSAPAKFTFAGTAGEVVTVTASAGTFPSACDASVTLLNPAGTKIAGGGCNGTSGFIGETKLATAGTYAIVLSSGTGKTGQVTLSLSANAANGTITVNGPAVTFTATHSGQGRDYAFTATAGERVYLVADSGTYPGACDVNMEITNSSATNFGSACAGHSGTVSNVTLAKAGTYIVDIIPQDGNVGSVKLSTYSCSTALCF